MDKATDSASKMKSFSLVDKNNKKYELSMSLNKDSIGFCAFEFGDITGLEYKSDFSYDQLIKQNKIFKLFDNITDIYTEIFDKFESSEICISLENNKILISIKYKVIKSNETINIILLPQKMQIENIVHSLCEKTKEIDSLKKEIEELKKENQYFKKCLEIHFGISFNFNLDELSSLLSEINKLSKIITNEKDLYLVLRGVKTTMNKKVNKFKLLMKASVDGDSASVFHQKCDNIPYTLTLVLTDKNRRFGGFTSILWNSMNNSTGSYKADPQAFIFSLDNHEICYPKNKKNGNSIYCHSNYGPTFGNGFDFYISNQCRSKSDSYDNTSIDSTYYTKERRYALALEYNFKVIDYEVYQLEFN